MSRVFSDLAYGADSPAQRLDLHLPAGDAPAPLVIWLHWGGWMSGSRALAPDAPQRRVLDAGFALASVGYRLSDEATFPAQRDDVCAAVHWLREHRGRYGLNGWIAAWGASAGGHLAALLGCERIVDAVVDWFGPTDFLAMDAQAAAQGCAPYQGHGHDHAASPESRLMGFPLRRHPERVRAANPVAHVTAGAPPFLIQHGTRDCFVPIAQSVLLHEALLACGVTATLELLPGGHGGAVFDRVENTDRVLAFLREHAATRGGVQS